MTRPEFLWDDILRAAYAQIAPGQREAFLYELTHEDPAVAPPVGREPREQPADAQGRFMLNWGLGFEAGNAAAVGPAPPWQPIETAPKMQTILLFAVSDIGERGEVKNWKMATGSWHTGYDNDRSKTEGYSPWNWDGRQLKIYELHPTHWMPLPSPPPGAPQ